jgi:hypothetical protein
MHIGLLHALTCISTLTARGGSERNFKTKRGRGAQFVPNRYADCLLKNTSTKDNKYVVNQKLEHVDDILQYH